MIEIRGLASGRSTFLSVLPEELDENFLKWLRRKDITIASSCDGEGVCKKCVIQKGMLTCQMTVSEFLKLEPSAVVLVTYL